MEIEENPGHELGCDFFITTDVGSFKIEKRFYREQYTNGKLTSILESDNINDEFLPCMEVNLHE